MIKSLTFIALFLVWTGVLAQNPTDYELWTGGAFGLQVNKKFKVDVQDQLRFNDTISTLKNTFTEFGLKYRLNKHFSFKSNYRYMIRPGKNNHSRISLDGYYFWNKKKFPLSFKYRIRFQNELGQKQTYARNKFSLDYNLSKLVDPYVSYELYFRFNSKNEFRVSRYTLGLEWRLSKKINITTYYRLSSDMNIKLPGSQQIFGLLFDYNMKLKKIKDTSFSK